MWKFGKCIPLARLTTPKSTSMHIQPLISPLELFSFSRRFFHFSRPVQGIEEFIENKKPNEFVAIGRGWTAADLRRKSFEDLHKLWYVLYKERNLLLSEKLKIRRAQRPYMPTEENRYVSVKRSMAAIKFVLAERKKIAQQIEEEKK